MRLIEGLVKGLLLVIGVVVIHCMCPVSNSEEPAEAPPAPPAAKKWFVEFGPFWRSGGDVDFRIKSLPEIPLSRPTVTAKSSVGPADRVADRQYDDGYVRMDYGTGVWDDNTWYWGYQTGSQVVGNQLLFHGSTFTAGGESLKPRESFSLDLDDEIGGEARIGRNVFCCKSVTGSVVLGVGFTSFCGSTGFQDLGYVWSARGGRITDTYNLLTDASELPPAPYSGTKDGPGYIIPNIPAKREIGGGVGKGPTLTEVYHNVQEDIDVDLWILSLGLDVRGKNGKVSFVAGAGVTGNFMSADSTFNWSAVEKGMALDSARYSGDDCAFEVGVYGEAGFLFDLSEKLYLSLKARYDHVFEEADLSFSNTNAEIDLSGVSGVATLGIVF